MRISVFNLLHLLIGLQVLQAHTLSGQDLNKTRVTIEMNNETLDRLFTKLKETTQFSIAYANSDLEGIIITFPAVERSVKEILDLALKNQPLTYKLVGSVIMILKEETKKGKTDKTDHASGEEATSSVKVNVFMAVTGSVTDGITQQPMPGVNIILKGTIFGTTTDADGKYSLDVSETDAVLVFSFIGYATQQVVVNGRSVIDVALAEEVQSLEEVVVVGYGTQKRENITGAVTSVKFDEALTARPTQNVARTLEGLVPGLNVASGAGGGQLDVAPTINIRGAGTIGSGSVAAPLILINGFEGDINTINPNDIESISIMKDAASSSIYGSRAAFGVILVTTKNGTMGSGVRTTVNFSSNVRFASPIHMAPYANAWEASMYYDEAHRNAGQTWTWLGNVIPAGQKAYYEGTGPLWGPVDPVNPHFRPNYFGTNDWNENLYKENSPSTENNLSVSGGGDNYSFYVSGNFLNQSGLLNVGTESWKRGTLNANLSVQLSKKVKVDYFGNFQWVNYDAPSYLQWGFYYTNSRRFAYVPWKYEDGQWGNPFAVMLEDAGRYNQRKDNNQHKIAFTFEPVKDWNIHVDGSSSIGTDLQDVSQLPVFLTFSDLTLRPIAVNASPYGNGLGDTYVGHEVYRNNYYMTNIYTDYFKQTGNGHYFKALLGFNAEKTSVRGVGLGKSGVLTPNAIALDAATSLGRDIFGNSQTWANSGFFGRLNYSYKDRYLFEANGRYDGSSRYIGDKRWGFFPSFSAGWNIANENFFEPLKGTINHLKLRGSYGSLGNMNTSNWYPFYPSMPLSIGQKTPSQQGVNYSGLNWLVNGALSNVSSAPGLVSASLTWERVRSWDVGLDFDLFDSHLMGVVGLFKRSTIGMVGPAPALPNSLGTGTPAMNNADMNSKGFEISLEWRDNMELMNSPFSYSIKGLLSDELQTVTRYTNAVPSFSTWFNGKQMGEIYGYTTIGMARTDQEMDAHIETLPNGGQDVLGQNWQAGDIMYKDLNGDGRISAGSQTIADPGDITIIGNSTPRYKFGANFNAAWKGFDLQVFLQGVGKRDLWPASTRVTPGYTDSDFIFWGQIGDTWNTQLLAPHMDYFRPEDSPYGANLDSYYPRPYVTGTKNNMTQTKYLQNAAYMRLKNLQIGYSLPTSLTKKVGIQKARIYYSGDNLFTFTGLKEVFDPEGFMGVNTWSGAAWGLGSAYPLSKVHSFGVNITL